MYALDKGQYACLAVDVLMGEFLFLIGMVFVACGMLIWIGLSSGLWPLAIVGGFISLVTAYCTWADFR